MSNFLRNIKFKIKKKWKSINDSPNTFPITKVHQVAASIFRIALKDLNSELILMPVANKRIIKLEKKGLYIKLEKYSLSITNHKYNYITEIPYELYEKLTKMFDTKMDNAHEQEEQQMINQLEVGIENVLKSIIPKK
jgi:formate dehydrogenase maturation protein FdhE